MIKLREIKKTYTLKNGYKKEAIKNINVDFSMNEFVAIIGESGSGKSTLLNILGGLDLEYEGNYSIDNCDSKELNWTNFRKQRIGFIFQDINLISHLTVLENVELALVVNGLSKEERRNTSIDILKKVGLENHINKKPGYLSGGEKQRVAIARALVNNPDIILADEPTGQLDTETAIEILDLIKSLCKDKLVIVVTHMEEFAYKYATRIISIEDGVLLSDERKENVPKYINDNVKLSSSNTMSVKDIFSLALKNILSFKRLTIFLVLVLSLGMSTFILITGIGFSIKENTDSILKVNNEISLINLTIFDSQLDAPLYKDYEENLNNIDNIKNVYFNTRLLPIIDFNENKDINDQIIHGLDDYLEFGTYMMKEDSYYKKHIVVGAYPNNKNEILIGRKTAINLIYEYHKSKNIDLSINNISNQEVFNKVKDFNITYFTTHRDEKENRYTFNNYYVQLMSQYKIVGIIDDDQIPMITSYRTDIDFYEPRVYVKQETFYEIMNQYKDQPLDTNIMEYYKPRHLIVEINNNDDYDKRLDTIKDILSLSNEFHYHEHYIDELYNNLTSFSNFLISVGIIFGSIIFIITTIIIGGLVYRNMENRKLEFGIQFSLGFSKNQIKKILFIESIIYSILGLITSYIITFVINLVIKKDLNILVFNMLDQEKYGNLISFVSIKWYFVLIVFILISYAFVRPINKFSKLDIINVLRKE